MRPELASELHAALWALLERPDATGPARFDEWRPLVRRVDDAVAAIEKACEPSRTLVTTLKALTAEFRAEAYARGLRKFAESPLYPWGVIDHVVALHERFEYQLLAGVHDGPCNCALVLERDMVSMLETRGFVKTATGGDSYDQFEDYRCPQCGRAWRYEDRSTEQYWAWVWRPLRESDRA